MESTLVHFWLNIQEDPLLAILAGVLLVFLIFSTLRLFRSLLARKVQQIAKSWDTIPEETLEAGVQSTHGLFLFALSLYVAGLLLSASDRWSANFALFLTLALILQGGIWASVLFSNVLRNYLLAREKGAGLSSAFGLLHFVGRLVVWSIVVLLVLDNVGVDIKALVAGLGVGGVAVALALQNILGDLFASLSIVLDRPFEVGDFVIVDNYMGTVERIGVKTTRVRSLSGEQLIFSNSDLLSSRIRNYKRMAERRVVFSLGVTYQTSPSSLREIPGIIQRAVENQEKTRFDRAHFSSFGDSSLLFEGVYFVLEPDYNVYMDIQQAINLMLFEEFDQRGIDFAYPTRTLYMQNVENAGGGSLSSGAAGER